MYRLLINLYEFGQFLRIVLWISVPLVVLTTLVTTWLHYRRKRQLPDELLFSLQGPMGTEGLAIPPILLTAHEVSGNGEAPVEANGVSPDPEEKENIYKGILWMKEKYEQYRDMADKRYEQLKEELARAEKKYQELLESGVRLQTTAASAAVNEAPHSAADRISPDEHLPLSDIEKASLPDLLEEKNRQILFLQQQLDQRIKNFHQAEFEGRENRTRAMELEELQRRDRHLLEGKQAYIDQLECQLVSERRKIEELVMKLQASSQQLLAIYEELDRSVKPGDAHSDTNVPDLGNPESKDS